MRHSINVHVHHVMAQNTAHIMPWHIMPNHITQKGNNFHSQVSQLFQVMGQNLILPRSDRTGKLSAAHPSPIRKTGYTGGPHTSSSWNTFKVFVDRFWPLSNGFHRWDSNPRKSIIWQFSVPNWTSYPCFRRHTVLQSSGTVWFKRHNC